jgi:hypothetical protein
MNMHVLKRPLKYIHFSKYLQVIGTVAFEYDEYIKAEVKVVPAFNKYVPKYVPMPCLSPSFEVSSRANPPSLLPHYGLESY